MTQFNDMRELQTVVAGLASDACAATMLEVLLAYPDVQFVDLGFGSLNLLTFLESLEAHFEFQIGDDLYWANSLRSVCSYLMQTGLASLLDDPTEVGATVRD